MTAIDPLYLYLYIEFFPFFFFLKVPGFLELVKKITFWITKFDVLYWEEKDDFYMKPTFSNHS